MGSKSKDESLESEADFGVYGSAEVVEIEQDPSYIYAKTEKT